MSACSLMHASATNPQATSGRSSCSPVFNMSFQLHQSNTLAHNNIACIKFMVCCIFSSSNPLSNTVSTPLQKLSMQVLKLQPQDQVKVGIVNGPFGQATVLHTQPDIVLQCQLWQNPPKLDQLYLVLAMPRPKVCACDRSWHHSNINSDTSTATAANMFVYVQTRQDIQSNVVKLR